MKFKSQRDRKRGSRKGKKHTLVLKLNDEEYQILKNQTKDNGLTSMKECAQAMFKAILYEMECTALEQERIHGRRFSHPKDCTCCEGTSESNFN